MKNIRLLKAGDDMKTITRAKYLDRIIELNGTPDIKIITGIRRSGKSKLMQAYIEYLKSHFENINIIFIDFMDLAYEEIKEYHALHAYVEEHYQESIGAGYIDVIFSLRVQAVDCQLKLGTHLNLVYKQVVRFSFLIMFFHIGV